MATAEVEMDGELPAAAQMPDAGRVEERGKLGEPAAAAPRRDRRELVPQILRERHACTPASPRNVVPSPTGCARISLRSATPTSGSHWWPSRSRATTSAQP